MDGARVAGAAMRRRERRLRSRAKHERMTVAMALAENLHQSRQKVEGNASDGYGHRRLPEPLVRGPAS